MEEIIDINEISKPTGKYFKHRESNKVFYMLVGKNGDENRYDALGEFYGSSFRNKNWFNNNYAIYFDTSKVLSMAGGNKSRRIKYASNNSRKTYRR
jgi:hypothetical protein